VTVTMTISRSDDSPIVVPETCEGPGFFLGSGFTRPVFTPRYGYAPDSVWVPGRVLLSITKEQGAIAGFVWAKAADNAGVQVLKTELEDALWQFTYQITWDDGRTQTFNADPCIPNWGEIVPGHDRTHAARASVVIPINPPGSP
jgi:hypothetical protein